MRPGFSTADRVPNAQPIEKCASSEPAIYEVRGRGVKLKRRIGARVCADIRWSGEAAGVGCQKMVGAALHDEPSAVSWLSMI